ncbi:MAG: hypothetical protein JNJ73_10970 [Hyphomonadaceae bacterium]|nr:hypothetical protein [Hyphomonadaceae bacterium]
MRLGLLLTAALLLAACVGGRGDRGPRIDPTRAPVFLSPSGEPIHPTADEPNPLLVWFRAADADHDGRLTEAEFKADAARFFALVDADRDGLATSPEVSALRARVAPELDAMAFGWSGGRSDGPIGGETGLPERHEPPPQGGVSDTRITRPAGPIRRTRPTSAASLLGEREPVLASDADFNRRVTAEEFAAAAADRFARLDVDHDGVLTEAGLQEILTARLHARR